MKESYTTSDIYLASYLIMIGKRLADIRRISPKKSEFVFAEDCSVEQEDFFMGEAKKFLDYARSLRDLKSMLYNKMEIDTDKFHSRKFSDEDADLSYRLQP